MIIIPVGLESRFKIIPFATLLVMFLIIAFSWYNFSHSKNIKSLIYNSTVAKSHIENIKEHISQTCIHEKQSFCNDITKMPDIYFVNEAIKTSESKKQRSGFAALEYIEAQTKDEVLQVTNPSLHQQQLDLKNKIQSYIKTNHLLHTDNIQIGSLIKSLLIHTESLYLVINVILLFVLGAYIEARVGMIGLLSIYFITGMMGSGFNVLYNKEIDILVGSASAISGIVGAFGFFFWRHQVKLIVFNPLVLSKAIFVPIYFFIPIFYLLSNLESIFEFNNYIPHCAHIISFFSGIALAYSGNIQSPLPMFYSFLYEKDYLLKAQKTNWVLGKFLIYQKWINDVPLNIYVFDRLVEIQTQMDESFPKDKNYLEFLKKDLDVIYSLNKQRFNFIINMPISWMSYLQPTKDLTLLTKKYNESVAVKNELAAVKLSYLVLKQLEWNDSLWEQKFISHYLNLKTDLAFKIEIKKLVELDLQARDCLAKVYSQNQSA